MDREQAEEVTKRIYLLLRAMIIYENSSSGEYYGNVMVQKQLLTEALCD